MSSNDPFDIVEKNVPGTAAWRWNNMPLAPYYKPLLVIKNPRLEPWVKSGKVLAYVFILFALYRAGGGPFNISSIIGAVQGLFTGH